jgi:hypothetical protein
MNNFVQQQVQFIQVVQQLRTSNDQLTADPTLISRYFATPPAGNLPIARTDITAQDVANAQAALVQVFFTLDSGSPNQKSLIYKMLP